LQPSCSQPLCFSPDGSLVALALSDYQVQVKVAKTQKLSCTLKGHGNAVIAVQWSQDQKYLCTGGIDK
jgi:WD40 repeat protein